MKKILYITNIPAPYRIDYFNELGKTTDLTVVFEARRAKGIRFNWNEDSIRNFKPIFLEDGEIRERRLNPAIFSYLKKGAYDAVVATSYGYVTEMCALFYLIGRRIPYYLELDGGVLRPGESALRAWIKKRLITSAKGIFSSSKATDIMLIHYGAKPERIHRYPFTSLHDKELLAHIPTLDEKEELKAELGFKEKQLILGVGQFIHRKGFDLLLSIAQNFPEGTQVCLAGAEPTEEYRNLSKGLNNVTFAGFLDHDRLGKYLRAADVFVLPTREDMWGLVVNEAMAYGLPVITTEGCIAGCELIRDGENGFLVPVEDRAALLDRILLLLNDPQLRMKMGEAALDTVSGYTIEQMALAHKVVFDREEENG